MKKAGVDKQMTEREEWAEPWWKQQVERQEGENHRKTEEDALKCVFDEHGNSDP